MRICESCHCGCCRNYSVSLTGYDILNIAKTLSVDPASFVQVLPVDEEKDVEEFSKHAALFKFTDNNDDIFYRFSMRMNESQLAVGTNKCQFLLEWLENPFNPSLEGIVARCGIYGCRPLVCAAYPSAFDKTGQQGVVFSTKSNKKSEKHPIYQLCPRKIKSVDIEGSSDSIMDALIRRKFELDFFKNLASYWNQKPGTISEFFIFIKKVYANRVSPD